MGALRTCILGVCVLVWYGAINSVKSLRIEDTGVNSVPVFLSRETCLLTDLVEVTGGNISYCDDSDGSTVPNLHWCDVVNVTEHLHNTYLTYQCEEGVWRRKFGTSTDLATGTNRHKRFFWLFLIPIVACVVLCGRGGGGGGEDMGSPPSYRNCPPTEIQNKNVYYAPRGEKTAAVVWSEPPYTGKEASSSLSCCGGLYSGQSFLGSVDGATHHMTYTVKDKYGRTDSCAFAFTVFYLACNEPAYSSTRFKGKCTNGLLYGSECNFHCAEGYTIQDGMSSSATCEKENNIGVEWTTLPECKKKICPTSSSPENGHVVCSSSMHEYGTMCFVTCLDGYRLSGTPFVYCQANGQWSFSADQVTCKDEEPPEITCSSRVFYAGSGKSTAQVYWPEPVVKDNLDNNLKAEKLSNINQGDSLGEGTYLIPYRATDSAGNSHSILSECSVTIQVQVVKCATSPTDSLGDTRFLRYTCSDRTYSSGVQCSLFCDLNLELVGTSILTCEREGTSGVGVWKWSGEEEPHCNVVACPPLTPPAHGAMTYDSINARPLYVMLCQFGYDSPVVGSQFTGRLSCQDSGTWHPLDAFPDCIISLWGDIVLPAELIYEGDCEDEETKEDIRQQVLKYLRTIKDDIDNSICPGKDCRVDNVVVVCGSRKRRATDNKRTHRITKRQTSYARVTFDFAMPFDLSNGTDIEAYNVLFPLLTAMGDMVAADVANGTLDIAGFKLAPDAFQKSSKPNMKCPSTLKKDGYKCKPCPKGTYLNATTGNCELCNIGKYNEKDGRTECDLCPLDHSTLKEGSKHLDNCTRLCEPGFFSSTTMVPCSACPLGTYQPSRGSSTCIPCPTGHTTPSTNGTSANQCEMFDLKVNNLNGNQMVGKFKVNVSTSILSVSLWVRRDIDGKGELTLTVGGNSSELLAITLAEKVTVQSGNISTSTAFIPSSTRWSHLLVEFDFSSYVLTVFVDGVQDVREVGLMSMSIVSGSVHMSSNRDTGLTISGFTINPRKLSTEERTAFSTSCLNNSTDTVFSMVDLMNNIVEGLVIISPTSCDPYDDCATDPCGNHTCVNGIGKFTCVCSGGWSGTHCGVPPDYCLNHDCKHGVCVQGNGSYTCNCTNFYTGSDCSTPPVNGGWLSWSDWTACDVTCGGSNQARQRLCVNPAPGPGGLDCNGPIEETQPCNTIDCPVCPPLKRGFGTTRQCETDPTSGDQRCNITCLAGTTFPSGLKPYPVYECGRSTGYKWNPFGQIPDCMDYSSPIKTEMSSTVVFNDIVRPEARAGVEEAVVDNFKTVPCVAAKKCEGTASIIDSQEHRKRSTGSSITVSFTITLPGLNSLDIAGYTQNGTVSPNLQTLLDAFLAIQEVLTYLKNNSATIFSVTVDGVQYSVDTASIDAFIGAYCNPGSSVSDGLCVECPLGTYEVYAVCWSCDVGTYQSSTGQTTCESCPTGYTTATYMATSIADCNVLTTRRPETTTTTEPADSDDNKEFKHEKPGSITTAIIVSVVLAAVAIIGIVIAVFCYKNARKQAGTTRSRSLASINMVYPNIATPTELFNMTPRNAEQANIRYVRDDSFVCSSPPPYEGFPQKKC